MLRGRLHPLACVPSVHSHSHGICRKGRVESSVVRVLFLVVFDTKNIIIDYSEFIAETPEGIDDPFCVLGRSS